MSDYFEYLNSINHSKKNIIRGSDSPEASERMYPRYITNKLLSYSIDAVLFVNELNIRSLELHGISNKMAYEFLLHLIPKGRRINKLERSYKSEDIDFIIDSCKYSASKANDVLEILSNNSLYLNEKEKSREFGGVQGKPKKK